MANEPYFMMKVQMKQIKKFNKCNKYKLFHEILKMIIDGNEVVVKVSRPFT